MSFSQERNTQETKIKATLTPDSHAASTIQTGVPFFDHMLTLFAFHAGLSLSLHVQGDLAVDDHHTVEDTGIVLGLLLQDMLQDKTGLERYGVSYVPMDESLSRVTIDLSNRPFLVFKAAFSRESIGAFALENVKEFFTALAMQAKITLHIENLYGENAHHQVESIFKAFGRSLNMAMKKSGDRLPSTKGLL